MYDENIASRYSIAIFFAWRTKAARKLSSLSVDDMFSVNVDPRKDENYLGRVVRRTSTREPGRLFKRPNVDLTIRYRDAATCQNSTFRSAFVNN